MAARGSMLGRKQEDAIAALLSQRNLEEAAQSFWRKLCFGTRSGPPQALSNSSCSFLRSFFNVVTNIG